MVGRPPFEAGHELHIQRSVCRSAVLCVCPAGWACQMNVAKHITLLTRYTTVLKAGQVWLQLAALPSPPNYVVCHVLTNPGWQCQTIGTCSVAQHHTGALSASLSHAATDTTATC